MQTTIVVIDAPHIDALIVTLETVKGRMSNEILLAPCVEADEPHLQTVVKAYRDFQYPIECLPYVNSENEAYSIARSRAKYDWLNWFVAGDYMTEVDHSSYLIGMTIVQASNDYDVMTCCYGFLDYPIPRLIKASVDYNYWDDHPGLPLPNVKRLVTNIMVYKSERRNNYLEMMHPNRTNWIGEYV